jgi:arginase family enzyme
MIPIALLGIPHDENSSGQLGAAEAPPHVRRALHADAQCIWSETGVDFGVPGRLVDHGDLEFDGDSDSWDVIEREVGRVLDLRAPLICLGGDHAITHPFMRAVRRRHAALTILHIDAHPDI